MTQSDRSRLLEWTSVALLLGVFFALTLLSARHKSITTDEPKHFEYGQRILDLKSERLNNGGTVVDDSKMPVTALNALPSRLVPYLPDGWLKRYLATLQGGRPVTMVFSVLVALGLYLWTKKLYGPVAALFCLFLYTFEPTIIANSHFVTTDIYATGMTMVSVFALWYFNRKPSVGRLVLLAVVVGLGQLAKFTLVFLPPILVVIQLIHDSPALWGWVRAHDGGALARYLRTWVLAGALAAAIILLIVNAGYFFNGSGTPLGGFQFRSTFFEHVQARLGRLAHFPVPLPYPYLQGLDLVKFRDEIGYGFGRIFLLGRLSSHGFPGYYFIDMAVKTPTPTLLAVLLGVILMVRARPSLARVLENELFLLVPTLWFLVYMNFFLHAQLGLRLILVIYPFLLMLASNLVRGISLHSRTRLITTAALSVWLIASVLRFYPHFVPYSSELIWDKTRTYAYLANGEFDAGQSQLYLADWLAAHPDAIMDPEDPVSGTIVATPKLLAGTPRDQDPDKYAWLRDHFDPVGVIAFTYPIFEVTPEDLQSLGMAPASR